MNPSAQQSTYPDKAILSFRLHEAARRNRSRMIWALAARLAGKFSLPLPTQSQIARWG